jgi:L-histidine N-alpha-methyltransferase
MREAPAAEAAARERMVEEVREGLSRPQKELPSKYFYDVRGSELFEEITRLPEYYPTRTERALLERWMPEWTAALRPRALVELGAGSAAKTRVVLDAMTAHGGTEYVPVDVSADFLADTAEALRGEYPGLEVVPAVADISAEFELPAGLPEPTLFAFLGSTIGNFAPDEAAVLLRQVRRAMRPGDRFLLGVDLRKDPARIEAAYNDARGVTAEFNRNILRVLNREAGTDFDTDAFEHRAFYDREEHRIEMHLVAGAPQTVHLPGAGEVRFAAGESVRTEISCKHDRASVDALFAASGLAVERWETDPDGLYALVLGAPVP